MKSFKDLADATVREEKPNLPRRMFALKESDRSLAHWYAFDAPDSPPVLCDALTKEEMERMYQKEVSP